MATGPQIVQQAKEQIKLLTGLKLDTVSGMRKDEQGWHITLEMVEMKRVPDSSDVLATYETLLNDEGTLVSYQRTRRYHRSEIMSEKA